MSSVYNGNIKLSLFGESHGKAIGIVIDGLPSGVKIDDKFVSSEMNRRKAKDSNISTARKEDDKPIILSGVLNKKTTGVPLAAIIENNNTRSGDYNGLRETPRPSHSDYTAMLRYKNYNDGRGGGHFSGRLTAALVFAGAVVKLTLKQKHKVLVTSHIKSIHKIKDKIEGDISTLKYEDFIKNYDRSINIK